MKTGAMAAGGMLLHCLTVMFVMVSCNGTGTEPTDYDRDELVVQAYLYAERPVNDVRVLHLTKALYDTMVRVERWNQADAEMDTIDTLLTLVKDSAVDNAQVTISGNGRSYVLDYRDSGWYRETGGSLEITAGQTYRIDVFADERHAWAETTVPMKSGNLAVSRDTLYMQEEYTGGELPSDNRDRLTVKWSNPDGAAFYYRIVIDSDSPDYGLWTGAYTDKDSLNVRIGIGISQLFGWDSTAQYLTKPSRYKFILYSTTPDYQSILTEVTDSTRHQDRWVGSPTNINGGLGIFTSFSTDSVFFNVAE